MDKQAINSIIKNYEGLDKTEKGEKLNVDDFTILKLIGKGSYGKVFLVRKNGSEEIYAMKILKKKDMMMKDQVVHIKTEKRIMELVDHPFIIKLRHAFNNKQKLYLITDFCPGGELYFHLSRIERFNESAAKFYAAQMVLALEHLHNKDVIYRDLKPENVIIDNDGYIKLTDFGLAKENVNEENKANSFCGTPEYLAPEVIAGEAYGKEVDWWSLGVILYEMLVGMPPFYYKEREKLFRHIRYAPVKFNSDICSNATSFIKSLLIKEPHLRLGSKGATEVKAHKFFENIRWEAVYNKQIKPPFTPVLKSNCDTKYIDSEFLCEPACDSYRQGDSIESSDDLFKDFSYNNEALTN